MPWNIQRAGSKYEVVNSETGRVVGTHPSRSNAQEQLAALHANVPDAKKSDDVALMANDGADSIDNTDTINRRRQYINGSKTNKKPKKAEQPTVNNWQGLFFPRRG
jgi:hypothetical protein